MHRHLQKQSLITCLIINDAERVINKLVHAGVLKKTSDAKRNRIYCADKILAILDEPAHI